MLNKEKTKKYLYKRNDYKFFSYIVIDYIYIKQCLNFTKKLKYIFARGTKILVNPK